MGFDARRTNSTDVHARCSVGERCGGGRSRARSSVVALLPAVAVLFLCPLRPPRARGFLVLTLNID